MSEHIDVTNVPMPAPPATPHREEIKRENIRALQRHSNAAWPAGLPESERQWLGVHRIKKESAA